MTNAADDHPPRLDRVQDPIVADAGGPEPLEATEELLARLLWPHPDQVERLQNGTSHRLRQGFQVFLRA